MWESVNDRLIECFFKKEGVYVNVCIYYEEDIYPQKYWLSTELYVLVQGYSVVIQRNSVVFL